MKLTTHAHEDKNNPIAITGYVLLWGDKENPDLQGEYFDRNSIINLPGDGSGLPIHVLNTYQDEVLHQVGVTETMVPDQYGIRVDATLHPEDGYYGPLKELIDDQRFHFAAGAHPDTVRINENGHIESWSMSFVVLTTTPTQLPVDVPDLGNANMDIVKDDFNREE